MISSFFLSPTILSFSSVHGLVVWGWSLWTDRVFSLSPGLAQRTPNNNNNNICSFDLLAAYTVGSFELLATYTVGSFDLHGSYRPFDLLTTKGSFDLLATYWLI